eukprot:g10433.t1
MKMRTTSSKKACVCDLTTGTAATGVECPAAYANVCAKCHPGYHLDGHTCVKNVCNCPHGEHAVGAACTVDGAMVCAKCAEGFDMVDGACQEKVYICSYCTCPEHGDPAFGPNCPATGQVACERCDYHYALDPQTRLCSKWTPKYLGCYEDNGDRDLPHLVHPVKKSGKTMASFATKFALKILLIAELAIKSRLRGKPEACDIWCSQYKYFAIQAGGECWCGNHLDNAKKPEGDCKACQHDSGLKCGGGWRNSVYEHTPTARYLGCFEDKPQRSMTMHTDRRYTFDTCLRKCASGPNGGDKYFALQAGGECACGPGYGKYGQKSDSDCRQSECFKDETTLSKRRDDGYCGGGWRNAVYEYVGGSSGPGFIDVAGVGYSVAGLNEREGASSCPAGANLATIELPSQMRFVRTATGGPAKSGIAVGFTDALKEGEWAHVEGGMPILHEGERDGLNWGKNEPNDWGNAGEDCAVLRANGQANDVNCDKVREGKFWMVCSKREGLGGLFP